MAYEAARARHPSVSFVARRAIRANKPLATLRASESLFSFRADRPAFPALAHLPWLPGQNMLRDLHRVVELGHEHLLHACKLNQPVLERCHCFPQAWLSVVFVILKERAVHIDPGRASP
jgi:hypothetical protein